MYRPPINNIPASRNLLDVETVIRGLTQDFCTAFNTGIYDQVGRLYTADAVFMIPHREPYQGLNGIERALRRLGEMGYQGLRLETTRVDYSTDMAIEMGRYTVSIDQGDIATIDSGRFVRAWRRLGAWLIICDSWNSSVPMADGKLNIDGEAKVA